MLDLTAICGWDISPSQCNKSSWQGVSQQKLAGASNKMPALKRISLCELIKRITGGSNTYSGATFGTFNAFATSGLGAGAGVGARVVVGVPNALKQGITSGIGGIAGQPTLPLACGCPK